MKKIYFYLLIIPSFFLGFTLYGQDSNLADNLRGKILLQVEQHGEAWYVSPENSKRHFLGRPDDAFSIMREQGIGISNDDLAKIPVSLDYLSGEDSSGDGLPDAFKVALGLDVNSTDSDGNGYDDFTELLHGYDPLGSGKLNHDLDFANSQAGRILLQVEQNGEAWYVNPENNKRYFLGRPDDAFSIMRNLGLGISDENLERISKTTESLEVAEPPHLFYEDFLNLGKNIISDCILKEAYFPGNLYGLNFKLKSETKNNECIISYQLADIKEMQDVNLKCTFDILSEDEKKSISELPDREQFNKYYHILSEFISVTDHSQADYNCQGDEFVEFLKERMEQHLLPDPPTGDDNGDANNVTDESIVEREDFYRCYLMTGAYDHLDPEIFGDIEEFEEEVKNICYDSDAKKTENILGCYFISDENLKRQCYYYFFRHLNSDCSDIKYDNFADDCLLSTKEKDVADNWVEGYFIDNRDGQEYRYVEIGNQTWMAENLNYDNGCSNNDFKERNDNAWCGYYNNSDDYKYRGLLYQWSAIMDGSRQEEAQGICPDGWYVPSDSDFSQLEKYLGVDEDELDSTMWIESGDAGLQLKSYIWGGLDKYGFSIYPSGFRYSDGSFNYISAGEYVSFWTSSLVGSRDGDGAWYRNYSRKDGVYRYSYSYGSAMYLRCIKD